MLKKEIELNKKVIVFLLLINIISLASYYSYALFTVTKIKNNAIILKTAANMDITTTIDNTANDYFVLPASGSKTVVVNLDTLYQENGEDKGITSALAYKMYYEVTNGFGKFTVTSEESFPNDKVEGVMQPYERQSGKKITGKVITLTFTNSSSNAITIRLGAVAGFEAEGASLTTQEELVLNTSIGVTPTASSVIAAKMAATSGQYIKSYDDIITQNPTFTTQDTYNTNNSKKTVYYFTSADSNNYAAVNGNVLFAGYCWQIIRTTDTGGLKLLYNGVYDETLKCQNTREPATGVIGTNGTTQDMSSYGTTNVYGTGYNYTGTTFTLTGQFSGKTWSTDYDDIIGNYTCLNTTGSCTTLYYIGGFNSTTSAYVAKYTIGTTSHYSELGKSPYNAYYYSPGDVGYMYNKNYRYRTGVLTSTSYGTSASWNGTKYTLSGTSSLSAPDDTHHYVCNTTDCTQIRYYYYKNSSNKYYYVLLEKGDINPITVMINGDNVNQKDSAIKGYIDNWYRENIANQGSSITSKIDTSAVYCNDRRITNLDEKNKVVGWDPSTDMATTTPTIKFYQYSNNKDLSCGNETDRFTADTGNTKAHLTYPVGLLTEPERGLMNSYYAKSYLGDSQTAQYYWGASPGGFNSTNAYVRYVYTSGDSTNGNTYSAGGVRPVVSLRPDVSISGEGTGTNPYIVS